MMVTKLLTTNLLAAAFICEAPFMNGYKVVGLIGSQFGSQKTSMISDRLRPPTTYYLLYKEKEKRGVKGVAAERLVTKVVGSQPSPTTHQQRKVL